jgi:hypothetical protein
VTGIARSQEESVESSGGAKLLRDTTAKVTDVPGFGQGGAVVYQVKDGTLKLKTVLEWKPPQ